jgi:hypothetical protein
MGTSASSRKEDPPPQQQLTVASMVFLARQRPRCGVRYINIDFEMQEDVPVPCCELYFLVCCWSVAALHFAASAAPLACNSKAKY